MRYFTVALASVVIIGLNSLKAESSIHSRVFLEPSVVCGIEGSTIKNAFGAGLTAGVQLNAHHSIAIEAISFRADTAYFSDERITFQPLLLRYNYTIALRDTRWSFHFGTAAGAVFEKDDYSRYAPGSFRVHITDTASAGGAELGCSYAFTDQEHASFDVTSLQLTHTKATSRGAMVLLEIKLGYKF